MSNANTNAPTLADLRAAMFAAGSAALAAEDVNLALAAEGLENRAHLAAEVAACAAYVAARAAYAAAKAVDDAAYAALKATIPAGHRWPSHS